MYQERVICFDVNAEQLQMRLEDKNAHDSKEHTLEYPLPSVPLDITPFTLEEVMFGGADAILSTTLS